MTVNDKISHRHKYILEQMRQGNRLVHKKSAKYEIAELGRGGEEVSLGTVGELEEAGWIWLMDTTNRERVWDLTQSGLALLQDGA